MDHSQAQLPVTPTPATSGEPVTVIGKLPFTPPKLTFVTPKLTKQGSVGEITQTLIAFSGTP